MMDLNWRWIAVALIVVNAVVFIIGRLDASPPPTRDGEPPPLDPELPRIQRVQAPTSPPDDTVPVCYTIGPLPTLLAQQRASDRLAPFSSDVQTRQTEADRDRGWWVYLPAADRNRALERYW